MAHLIEEYALHCGAKISKPYIYDTYFPIPFEKYVLIHAGGGMTAKIYEYYNEVVSIIQEPLRKSGYEIIQIGGADDIKVNNIASIKGQTNLHQTAYVIKNASLLIGNDSCNVHIASGYDIPVVALYGPTTEYNHGPYFSSKENRHVLSADLKGNKPSYLPDERPKSINTIKPEDVASAVFKALGIKVKINFKTVFVGERFNNGGIDLVPNCVLPPEIGRNIIPQIRMDYEFNEAYLIQNLRTRKHIIITDKAISLDILKVLKGNIHNLMFEVKDSSGVPFIEGVKRLGIPYTLFSSLTDKELGLAKLDFFDFGSILDRRHENSMSVKSNPLIKKGTLFKTNRFVVSDSKIYLSKVHLDNKQPTESFTHNIGIIPKDDEFFKFSEYYYIFNN